MTSRITTRLNDSGEDGLSRVFERGALHFSRSQQTSPHAHYAWKLHVGIDAPVWVRTRNGLTSGRAVVVPPNLEHATGAIGWSVAVFVAPGSRGTAFRGTPPFDLEMLSGARCRRLVDLCRHFEPTARNDTPNFVDELARIALDSPATPIDRRVERSLQRLRESPGTPLKTIAQAHGITLDRLSRLVSQQTGLPLRRHAIWSRLMRLMSAPPAPTELAAAAVTAGFSDHAHMTRTFRAYLGRAPSEFRSAPDVIAAW